MNDVDITGMTLEAMQTRAAALRSDILQTPVVTLSSPMVDEVLGGTRLHRLQRHSGNVHVVHSAVPFGCP